MKKKKPNLDKYYRNSFPVHCRSALLCVSGGLRLSPRSLLDTPRFTFSGAYLRPQCFAALTLYTPLHCTQTSPFNSFSRCSCLSHDTYIYLCPSTNTRDNCAYIEKPLGNTTAYLARFNMENRRTCALSFLGCRYAYTCTDTYVDDCEINRPPRRRIVYVYQDADYSLIENSSR